MVTATKCGAGSPGLRIDHGRRERHGYSHLLETACPLSAFPVLGHLDCSGAGLPVRPALPRPHSLLSAWNVPSAINRSGDRSANLALKALDHGSQTLQVGGISSSHFWGPELTHSEYMG